MVFGAFGSESTGNSGGGGSCVVLPAELAADTSALGTVAQAVWYSEQDGGRWRLESFERLRPLIRAGDPLAGALGDGVLWGSSGP